MNPGEDKRIVMTLDAGGTSFRCSAICANKLVIEVISMPSCGDNLRKARESHFRTRPNQRKSLKSGWAESPGIKTQPSAHTLLH